MNRRTSIALCLALVSATGATGCASSKLLINPEAKFPVAVDEATPALLFPINLSHLGSGGDPLAMGLTVSASIATRFGSRVVSAQPLYDFAGNLSFELAEVLQSQAHAGKWVMDGSAAKVSEEVAGKLAAMVAKLVEQKAIDHPVRFRYLIALHSHGSSTMGGSVLSVESWGAIYDLESKTITSYLETKDNLANNPDAVLAAIPSTYNGIITKLLAGTFDAPKDEEKK